MTNRTLELYQGTVESYPGNFTQYKRLKAERLEVQRRTYEKQQEEIAKMEDFIRRYHFGDRHQQAEDRRKKLERIERVAPPREIAAPPMGFPPASRTGDIVLARREAGQKLSRQAAVRPICRSTFCAAKNGAFSAPTAAARRRCCAACSASYRPMTGRVIFGSGVKAWLFRSDADRPR